MAFFDLSIEELRDYRPEIREEPDFDTFWDETLADSRKYPMSASFQPVSHPFDYLDIYDVSFPGFEGQPVKAWFLRPRGAKEALPCLIEYIGYGGGRSLPHEWLTMASAGMAHFVMDTRGQGAAWSSGDTPDIETRPEGGQHPGFMTRGIDSKEQYYYRRLITDAVRAFDCVTARQDIDSDRIAVGGVSQGGGLSLAVAGLVPDIQIVLPDVPFLCHFHRALRITDSHPYSEIKDYLKIHRLKSEKVHRTLSYFDGANFSKRAGTKALFSTSLMDDICPPSTVFAAYNNYAGEKDIQVWEFNGHEGGGGEQKYRRITQLVDLWNL